MDPQDLREARNEYLYKVMFDLTSEGVKCIMHSKEPFVAYLTDDGRIGRHYVQVIRRPAGFPGAPYLFGLVINLPFNDNPMPFGLNVIQMTEKMGVLFAGFSYEQELKLVCSPDELKDIAPFVAMRIMCDISVDDPPFVLCPVRTCTPPMSKEIWTLDAFRADEKACLDALKIADEDDPLK
jgi:hypothetical protein